MLVPGIPLGPGGPNGPWVPYMYYVVDEDEMDTPVNSAPHHLIKCATFQASV